VERQLAKNSEWLGWSFVEAVERIAGRVAEREIWSEIWM